jgi:hypothetical protein
MPGAGGGRVQVETYSGARLHERPRRFTRGGAWLTVRRVVEQWREPQLLRFKVVADDQQVYLLSYHVLQDAWEVEPAEGGGMGIPG